MVCVLVRGLVGLGFAGRPPTRPQYGFRGDDHSFGFQRNYEPRFPPSGACIPSMGHGKFGGKGMMFSNPSFEQWLDTGSTFFVLTPVSSR
jgi:hypothetical protein